MQEQISTESKEMNIGVAQYTICGDGTGLLDRTAELGFAGVELMIDSPESQYLSWSADEINRFVQHAKKVNVSLPSVAVSMFISDDSLVNIQGQSNAVSIVSRSLEFTASVGATNMLLCTFFASDPDTREKKANLIEVIKQIESLAGDLRVAIALESPLPAADLVEMVDSMESRYFGVYYDVGNAIFLGYDPAAEIEQLCERILSIHIKDTAKNLGDSHLGFGRLDMDASMAALDKINYGGWLIIETPSGQDDALSNDIKVIRGYLK